MNRAVITFICVRMWSTSYLEQLEWKVFYQIQLQEKESTIQKTIQLLERVMSRNPSEQKCRDLKQTENPFGRKNSYCWKSF